MLGSSMAAIMQSDDMRSMQPLSSTQRSDASMSASSFSSCSSAGEAEGPAAPW